MKFTVLIRLLSLEKIRMRRFERYTRAANRAVIRIVNQPAELAKHRSAGNARGQQKQEQRKPWCAHPHKQPPCRLCATNRIPVTTERARGQGMKGVASKTRLQGSWIRQGKLEARAFAVHGRRRREGALLSVERWRGAALFRRRPRRLCREGTRNAAEVQATLAGTGISRGQYSDPLARR